MKVFFDNKLLIDNCVFANNFFSKLSGKYFTQDAVLLVNCNLVHTFFMKENIDIIFIDKEKRITQIKENVNKNRIICGGAETKYTLETYSGFIKSAKIKTGDILEFEK